MHLARDALGRADSAGERTAVAENHRRGICTSDSIDWRRAFSDFFGHGPDAKPSACEGDAIVYFGAARGRLEQGSNRPGRPKKPGEIARFGQVINSFSPLRIEWHFSSTEDHWM